MKKAEKDPRNPKRGTIRVCETCGAENYDYIFCWNGKHQVGKTNLNFSFKYGKTVIGEATNRMAQEFGRKHGEDLIQPEVYDKSQRKMVLNPEYTKRYGNPYRDMTNEIGSGNQEMIDSGALELIEPDANT